jgi:hypothetical protein
LSFSKWSKAIESGELMKKTHGTAKQLIICVQNSWIKYPPL